MNSYTNSTMASLQRTSSRAIKKLAEGTPVIEILRDIYCTLPDKSPETGAVMADRVLELVAEYESNKKLALENLEAWAAQKLDKLTDGRDCAERCSILAQTLAGFTALNDPSQAEELLTDLKEVAPESASDELEQQLRDNLLLAMQNSTLGLAQLNALLEALENHTSAEAAKIVMDFGKYNREAKAIMAMTAYVYAKNGSLEELSPELTLDEIMPCVCLSCDTQEIVYMAETGQLDAEKAATMIQTLGTVAGMLATIAMALTAAATTAVFLTVAGVPAILSFPAVLLAGSVVSTLVREEAVNCATGALAVGWSIVNGTAQHLLIPGAKLLIHALQKVYSAARNALEKVKLFMQELKEDALGNLSKTSQSIFL